MTTRRVALTAAVAMFVLPLNLRPDEHVSLTALDHCQAEFSGREVMRRYRVESKRAWDGRLVWTLSAKERSLARGEQPIQATANSAAEVAIKLRLDPLREGIVFPAELGVAVVHDGTELARVQHPLSFFPDDPFAARSHWLAGLKGSVLKLCCWLQTESLP